MKDAKPDPLGERMTLLQNALSADRIRIIGHATKKEALDTLISLLADSGDIVTSKQALADAIWAREKLMSTGIGLSLAIPHARLSAVRHLAAAALLVPGGIADYESLDNQPIKLVVMIVAREGEHAQHLRLLAQLSARLKHTTDQIFACPDEEELLKLLVD